MTSDGVDTPCHCNDGGIKRSEQASLTCLKTTGTAVILKTVPRKPRLKRASEPSMSPSTFEQIKDHFDVQEHQLVECQGLGQIMTCSFSV